MGALIGIYGMPGAGKTTFMANLATTIASMDKLTGIVATDLRYPSIQHAVNGFVIDEEKSLNRYLAQPNKLPGYRMFVNHPKMKYLYAAGVDVSQQCLRATPVDEDRADRFWMEAPSNFDYLFVEIDGIMDHAFAASAANYCDQMFNIVKPTVQGVAWHRANYPAIQELRPGFQPYTVSNADRGYLDLDAVQKQLMTKVDWYLPYTQNVERSECEGNPVMLSGAQSKDDLRYVKEIKQIATLLNNSVRDIKDGGTNGE